MNCPNCQGQLQGIDYEGVRIETCSACGGEWLDDGELGKIVNIREKRFDSQERRAIAESTTITGVVLEDVDRDLPCPKCGGTTSPVNYGGDSGIILSRCDRCRGFWLDAGELEKVQMLVEGWDDRLPEDLEQYGPKLREVAERVDREDDVTPARHFPGARFVNAMINGILDLRL